MHARIHTYLHTFFQTEEQRINDELHAATQPYANEPGCPICILDPEGNPLQMNVTGGVHVPCPDGYQKKGFSCSKLSTCDISLIKLFSF